MNQVSLEYLVATQVTTQEDVVVRVTREQLLDLIESAGVQISRDAQCQFHCEVCDDNYTTWESPIFIRHTKKTVTTT